MFFLWDGTSWIFITALLFCPFLLAILGLILAYGDWPSEREVDARIHGIATERVYAKR